MRLLIIVGLLINLGIILTADIFAKDVHRSAISESTFSSHQDPAGSVYSGECPGGEHSDSECFDPCHAGKCHFGHCSVAIRANAFKPLTLNDDQSRTSKSDDVIEEPYLEGHRRPPKLS